MVDFAKLLREPRKPRTEYLYECVSCGERGWFHAEMRGDLGRGCVDVLKRRCRGPMALVTTRLEAQEESNMGFAEIQAAFAQNAQSTAQAAAQPMQVPAFAPTTFAAPQGTTAPAFPTPSFAPTAAPVGQTAFAFTPPAGFDPNSAPPINPPGERAALTAPEPQPSAPAVEDPDPPKAKRGRKPKAEEPARVVNVSNGDVTVAALPGTPPSVQPSIEGLVQALYALGVSSVHLTFTKEGA